MRKVVHTTRVSILAATLLIAVALPVTVLFSREGADPVAPAARGELAVAADMAAPADVMDVAPVVDWTGDAAQSASMVLVGSLLIGIGSIVRRAL
ncbi:MAG TPA: hypothetical protein VFJ02_19145 [Vicinamibacterales bacterium]|nr:hypothetical protein [Vicinamibacterales bacterium]